MAGSSLVTEETGRNRRSTYTMSLVETEYDFHALAAEWTRLHERSVPRNPFLSYAWTAGCWAHLPGRGVPFILTARLDGRLLGVAPLCLRRSGPFRVLHFIGDGASDYLGFLRAADHPGVTSALVEHLSELRARWDLAFLRRLCAAYTDPLAAPSPPPPGLVAVTVDAPGAPYLGFAGEWAEVLRSGPPQLRHTQRWARKFTREGGTVERMAGADALELIDEFVEVEEDSWKWRAGIAWFQSSEHRRIIQHALATLGTVDVWRARMEGRTVAFLLNFVTPERVMFYQGAYRERYRRFYAGGVLHFNAIRDAWESGVREYDFLIGAEGYKDGWTTGVHPQQYLSLFPDTARGRLAYATIVAPRWFLRRFERARWAYGLVRRVRLAVRTSAWRLARRTGVRGGRRG